MGARIEEQRGQLRIAEGAREARHRWSGLAFARLDAVEEDEDRVARVGLVERGAERQVDAARRRYPCGAPEAVRVTRSTGTGEDRRTQLLPRRRLWRFAPGGSRQG